MLPSVPVIELCGSKGEVMNGLHLVARASLFLLSEQAVSPLPKASSKLPSHERKVLKVGRLCEDR